MSSVRAPVSAPLARVPVKSRLALVIQKVISPARARTLVIALLAASLIAGISRGVAEPLRGAGERTACISAAPPRGGVNLDLTALANRPSLRIVAFGSSSTAGVGDAEPYPGVLETELARLRPHQSIAVINRGRGGDGVPAMLDRLGRDVIDAAPDLVIWQAGVNDVLVDTGTGRAEAGFHAGLARLAERRIPVVMMDVQDAPRTRADPDLEPMNALMAGLADGREVGLFQRRALMTALTRGGAGSLVEADGLHLTAAAQACVGLDLAVGIDAAMGAPPPIAAR